jgi:hypothetical protein
VAAERHDKGQIALSEKKMKRFGAQRQNLKDKPRGPWPPSGVMQGKALYSQKRCKSGLERSDKNICSKD